MFNSLMTTPETNAKITQQTLTLAIRSEPALGHIEYNIKIHFVHSKNYTVVLSNKCSLTITIREPQSQVITSSFKTTRWRRS